MTNAKDVLRPLDSVQTPVDWSEVTIRIPGDPPDLPPRSRLAAGVVAFVVFVAAAALVWVTLRRSIAPQLGTAPCGNRQNPSRKARFSSPSTRVTVATSTSIE